MKQCEAVKFGSVNNNAELFDFLIKTLGLYEKCSAKTEALQTLINAYNGSLEVTK